MNLSNKFFAIIAMVILTVLAVACESKEPTTPEPTTEVTEVTEVPTEEVAEPKVTEESAPTEEVIEPEPTEEPVSDNPNIVDGYDFTDYNEDNSDESYDKVVDSMTYDSVKFIVHRLGDYENWEHTITEILSDGDDFYWPNDGKDYFFYFYFPKDIKTVEVDGMDSYEFNTPTYLYDQGTKNGYSANVRSRGIITENGYNLTGHVVYTDGTEETIVITLYPEQ